MSNFLKYYQENGGWPQHCQDDPDGPCCSRPGQCVKTGVCKHEQEELAKKPWRELPCNVPGYDLSMGQYADLVTRCFNKGDFAMAFHYLNEMDKQDRTALSRLNKAVGNFK